METALAQEADSGVLDGWGLRYLQTKTPLGTRLVFVDMSNELSTMNGLIKTCLLIGAASLAVFFVISLLLARWAVKPIEEAWKQQKQFVSDSSHELNPPLTVKSENGLNRFYVSLPAI